MCFSFLRLPLLGRWLRWDFSETFGEEINVYHPSSEVHPQRRYILVLWGWSIQASLVSTIRTDRIGKHAAYVRQILCIKLEHRWKDTKVNHICELSRSVIAETLLKRFVTSLSVFRYTCAFAFDFSRHIT